MLSPEKSHEVFHQTFSRYGDGLYYYTLKLTGDEEKAKDIVQECFLRLWENINIIDTQSDLLPLLVTYIKNLLTDDFRKAQKRQQVFSSLQHKAGEGLISPEVESQLNVKDQQQQLNQCLSQFPEKRRTIFRLIKEQGLSYREVSELLSLSLPDVKKQMRLSLQLLRKAIQFFCSFFFPFIWLPLL